MDPIEDLKIFNLRKGAVANWFNENFEKLRTTINALIDNSKNYLKNDLSNITNEGRLNLSTPYEKLTFNASGITLKSNTPYYYTMTEKAMFILPTDVDIKSPDTITVDIYVPTFKANTTIVSFNQTVGWYNPAFNIDRAGLYKLIIDKNPFYEQTGYKWSVGLSYVSQTGAIV